MTHPILISGASSIIGIPLLKQLRKQGEQLIEISRNAGDDEHHCRWDMAAQELSETSLFTKNFKLKTMVHCAPIWLLPSHMPALAGLGIQRVIVFSSTSIEGKSGSSSSHEQHIVQLLKQAEKDILANAQTHKIDVTIFRPTMIYGYGQGLNLAFIANMIQRFGFFPIVSGATGLRQPVHANDLAQAVCLSMTEANSYGKTYALSGAQVMTYAEMVEKVFESLGKPVRLIKLPLSMYRIMVFLVAKFAKMPIDPAMADRMRENLDFDCTPAQQDFAYSPGPFMPNGLKDILAVNDQE